ncbi:ABC transporter permease [candidate division KSB1 bacterium]
MKHPPKIAEWILSRLVEKDEREFILGDLKEFYLQRVKTYGYLKSVLWYWFQIVKSFHLFISNSIIWSFTMFRNYLKTAFRNAKRQKAYSFINISGLAIGMACSILIFLYIQFEMSYDSYHEKADRTYLLNIEGNWGGNDFISLFSAAPTAETMKNEFPEIENTARLRPKEKTPIAYKNNSFYETGIYYADETVFDIFSYRFISGDTKTALKDPYSVVITKTIAEKYFGNENPLGKTFKFNAKDNYIITGIIEDISPNTLFKFDMLCSLKTLYKENFMGINQWLSHNFLTYLLLDDKCEPGELEKKFPAFVEKHVSRDLQDHGASLKYFLQNIKDIRMHTSAKPGQPTGIMIIYIFSAVAILVLIIACINFMNLATAIYITRAREVGVRKVFGANRKNIVRQFLAESFLYSFIALILAMIIVQFLIPFINSASGAELSFKYLNMSLLILVLTGIALFVGLAAGSYPSFYLAAFEPVRILKGSITSGKSRFRLRNTLVIFQFTISIILIIGTGIISKQLNLLKTRDLGFNKENIVVIPFSGNEIRQSLETIKKELKKNPGVINVAAASVIPGEGAPINSKRPEGLQENESKLMAELHVDHDYIPALDVKIIEGRNFSPEFASDISESVIINETAAEEFGWENPLGKTINETKTVIGVVKDFHVFPLYMPLRPMYIRYSSNEAFYDYKYVMVRISPQNINSTISYINKTFKEIDPQRPFDYFFLDESLNARYKIPDSILQLTTFFTVFTILIASLGLFGLASFTAENRTKEIGIRKIIGASASGIVMMLSKQLLKNIIFANIIAWPIAYWLFYNMLQTMTYRTEISIWTFILSAAVILVIGFFAVSYQSVKASLSNPVDSLRAE